MEGPWVFPCLASTSRSELSCSGLQFECGLSPVLGHMTPRWWCCVWNLWTAQKTRDKLEKVCSSRSRGSQPSFPLVLYFLLCKIVKSLSSTNPTMTDHTLSNHKSKANNKSHPLKLLLASCLVTTRTATHMLNKDEAGTNMCWQRSDCISHPMATVFTAKSR